MILLRTLTMSLLLLPISALAAVVTLENGDRLSGTIVKMKDGKLAMELAYGGNVELPWTAVTALESDEVIRVQLSDDTRVRGAAVSSEAGKMALEGGEVLESVQFAMANVEAINPPTLAELQQVKVTGKVNVGIGGTSGNSETDRVNLDAQFEARTAKNRYTAGLQYNKAEEDGNTTVDNAAVFASYDHFFNGKWFWNNSITVQRNDRQDLDLRTAIGTGIGYQVFETDPLVLSFTAGVSYLAEDFASQPSERSAALRLGTNYEHDWLTWLRFFHNNELLYSVEDSDDWVFRSRSGLTFPIAERVDGSFQLNYDFDNSPAPGNEEEDLLYLFNIGYKWH